MRRIPLVLTEADSHLGITNRLLAARARRVCLAFADRGARRAALPRDRPAGAAARARPRAARARFGLAPREPCVLVFGGSLGARTINEAAVEAFAAAPFRVLHAAGERDHAALAARVAGRALRPAPVHRGLRRRARRPATSCVARAGGSIFEIAATGKPAILVPYPHATADHQTANARWMADAGAAVVVPDDELTPARLRAGGRRAARRPARLAAMAAASAALARPDAAQDVADEVLAAAAGARRDEPPTAGPGRRACTSSASAARG